jgi:segregation and condensation protein A
MDLLLHLVHQREVPIEQVEMSEICEQYLEIINRTAVLDLERATEYLVIAATLVSLKSQSLLPPVQEEESVEGDPFDRRFYENLRERLKAYEQTKNQAAQLMALPQLGLDTFPRRPQRIVTGPDEFIIEHEQTTWLGELFTKLMKRVGHVGYLIRLEPVSVVSTMMKCLDFLSGKIFTKENRAEKTEAAGLGPSSFLSMVRQVAGSSPPRATVIASFIAILELAKRGLMHVQQGEGVNVIQLELHQNRDELQHRLDGLHVEETAEGIVDTPVEAPEHTHPNVISMADYRMTTEKEGTEDAVRGDGQEGEIEHRREANRD